jgi:hypothetical protein
VLKEEFVSHCFVGGRHGRVDLVFFTGEMRPPAPVINFKSGQRLSVENGPTRGTRSLDVLSCHSLFLDGHESDLALRSAGPKLEKVIVLFRTKPLTQIDTPSPQLVELFRIGLHFFRQELGLVAPERFLKNSEVTL